MKCISQNPSGVAACGSKGRFALWFCIRRVPGGNRSHSVHDSSRDYRTVVASGNTSSTFQHQIGKRLGLLGQMNFIAQAHLAFPALYSGCATASIQIMRRTLSAGCHALHRTASERID